MVGVPHDKWGETPKAVVVPREGATSTEAELIDWCTHRVGSVKKPNSVDSSDGPLPKSPADKLVRRLVKQKYWESHQRAVHGA